MTAFLKKRGPVLWALILMTMLVLSWLFPSSRGLIEAAFLLVSLSLASLVVVAKNWESYRQGKLARGGFVGHSLFDVFSIVLAMAAAGLLANSIARLMLVEHAGSQLVRIAAVIVTSLLAGVSIGVLMKRIRRRVLAH